VCELVQCQEKISAVQAVGGSELQRVVDRTRDEDFTRAVVQRVPQCSEVPLGAIRELQLQIKTSSELVQ
jgi:hypothetical protein